MNLDALWNYMQIDLKADKFESDMRQSPKRQLLLKHRNFLKDQQANIAKIESDVSNMNTRMEAVKEEVIRLTALLSEQKAQLEKNPPKTLEEVQEKSAAVSKVLEALTHFEQELQKMRKDADMRDRQQKDIRVRAAKAKAEFDQVKIEYDREFARDTIELKELRAKVEKEGAKIDEADLERYKKIKQHVTPPMALLMDSQCSGCFMSLPLGTLRDAKGSEQITVCDNCGRILYLKD
ncbi:MAG: hypothetical protein IJD86_09790 [Clostridia bacterium]|nr:hypothetical protein [Clostridia bacterium]